MKEKKTRKKEPKEKATTIINDEPKELSFKEQLIKSNLSKRISLTTLEALANNLDKEAALKEIIILLIPFFRLCSLEEFIELSTAIKELNGR